MIILGGMERNGWSELLLFLVRVILRCLSYLYVLSAPWDMEIEDFYLL